MKRFTFSILLMLLVAASLYAQQEEPTPSLEQWAYNVKYMDGHSAARLARSLLTEYGRVELTGNQNIVIINDLGDNIRNIVAMLEKADVRPDTITITIHSFWAYADPEGIPALESTSEAVAEALEEVTRLMTYKAFEPLGQGSLQLSSESRTGALTLGGNISVEFKPEYRQESKFMLLRNFQIHYRDEEQGIRTIFQSDININDGEVAVAGIVRPNGSNRALVSIVSMRVR